MLKSDVDRLSNNLLLYYINKNYNRIYPLAHLTHSRRHSQCIHVSVDWIFLKMYFLCRHITPVISDSALYRRSSLPEISRAPSGMSQCDLHRLLYHQNIRLIVCAPYIFPPHLLSFHLVELLFVSWCPTAKKHDRIISAGSSNSH